MGVMFADESPRPADFLERERDVASLIELLKMAEEKWPNPQNDEISESEMLSRDQALLEMWPEACRRIGFPKREIPAAVIKRWQRKNGLAQLRAATQSRARVFRLFCEARCPFFRLRLPCCMQFD